MKKIVNGLLEQCEGNIGHMPKLTLMPTVNYYFIALSYTFYFILFFEMELYLLFSIQRNAVF
jgi:hypothetical protein